MSNNQNSLIIKYRPTCFGQVVGHTNEIESIVNNLKNGSKQTMIFTGVHGTGKTTTARLVAAWLNCENENKNVNVQCNCENCLATREGSLSDILEYDGASITGIDGIRDLQSRLTHHPINTCRVIIIDECHKLSKPAQNALLKTLEEPAKNTLFILCTTELNNVLPTIISRSRTHWFNEVPPEIIKEVLEGIIEKEILEYLNFDEKAVNYQEKDIEDKHLYLITQHSNGSIRDAISLLSKISVVENLTEDIIYSLIGGVSKIKLADFFLAVFSYNTTQALIELKEIFKTDTQPEQLYKAIEDFLQITIYGVHRLTDNTLPEYYQNIISLVNSKDISNFLKSFWQIRSNTYHLSKLFFDVVVLDYCFVEENKNTKNVKNDFSSIPEKVILDKPKVVKKPLINLVKEEAQEVIF